jgi:hypothetical protein
MSLRFGLHQVSEIWVSFGFRTGFGFRLHLGFISIAIWA